MSLEKVVVIDKIEVLETGHIQIRQATKIIEDGKEIGKSYHRWVLSPGDSLKGQEERVKAIAKVIWSEKIIAAHKDRTKENYETPTSL